MFIMCVLPEGLANLRWACIKPPMVRLSDALAAIREKLKPWYVVLFLWSILSFHCSSFLLHSIHFHGHRHYSVVISLRSFMFFIYVLICCSHKCLCHFLLVQTVGVPLFPWVFFCLVQLWQVSGCSLSALGLAGIVAFSSSLFSVLSRLPSGIPLGRLKNSFWTEWKSIF